VLLQTYARLLSTYGDEDIMMEVAELEQWKRDVEPQHLANQNKLRSLKTELQV